MQRSPMAAGGLLAVLAAATFGATVPLTQRAGRGVGPFATAACLYGGACLFAAAMTLARRSPARAPARFGIARIVVIALLGAAIAPTLLAWGLQRVAGMAAALLLNFEAVFTVLLARAIWREALGRRVVIALAAMFAGGALLAIDVRRSAGSGALGGWGAAAVAGATLAWATENVISLALAEQEPFAVVAAKSAIGAALTAAIALATGDALPDGARLLALGACGATGYGLSLALYLQAQRRVGAARTASIFALAPFVGAIGAWILGDRALSAGIAGAAALFAAGVALHLTEGHRHRHRHEALVHEHPHRHDDGHHDHRHAPPVAGEHTHAHAHEPVEHEHPHGPDLHHRHGHGS
jgi:drug/metabolite transporter (DMT)-like permease